MKNHLKDFPSVLEKIPSNYSITGKNQTLRLSKEGISLSFQVKLLTLQTGTHTHTRTHTDPRDTSLGAGVLASRKLGRGWEAGAGYPALLGGSS